MILSLILTFVLQAAAPNGAVIGGKITNSEGAPLSYAAVQLRRTTPSMTYTAATDSRGQFEFRNLASGTYSVNVAKPGFVSNSYLDTEENSNQIKLHSGEVRSGIDVKLTRAAVISGRITDSNGEPVVDAQVRAVMKVYREGRVQTANRSNTQTNDHGEYRLFDLPPGRYYIEAGKWSNNWQNAAPLATQFFPGASRFEEARSITVKAAEEASGINLTLTDAIVMTVTGHVINSEDGQPLSANINMNPLNTMGIGTNGNAMSQPDGSFKMQDIAAGLYRVNVNIVNRGGPQGGPPPPPSAPRRNMNMTRVIELNPGNASGLVLNFAPGATVTGKITVEGGSNPKDFQVSLLSRTADGNVVGSSGARTNDDGEFTMPNVQPGMYEPNVFVSGPPSDTVPPRFFITSVKRGTQDLTDRPIEIPESGEVALSITVDSRTGNISGKVFDGETEGDTKPLGKIHVTLISADPKKRLLQAYYRTATSASSGGFKMEGVIPGDYLMIAWPGDDAGQLLDPDVFRMVEKQGVPITVGRSVDLKQDLHVTPALRTLADTFSQ